MTSCLSVDENFFEVIGLLLKIKNGPGTVGRNDKYLLAYTTGQ